MTTIEKLSASESSVRILKRLESECGFGMCAGDPACRDKHCPGHPCQAGVLTLPVVEGRFLDDYIQRRDSMTGDPLRLKDGIPVLRSRADDMPIQYADEDEGIGKFIDSIEHSVKFWLTYGIGAIVGGLVLAAVIYTSTK